MLAWLIGILILQVIVAAVCLIRLQRLYREARSFLDSKTGACEQMTEELTLVLQDVKKKVKSWEHSLPPPLPLETSPLLEPVKKASSTSTDVGEILCLKDQGLSAVEIAKQLGRPTGEVDLIIRLYSDSSHVPSAS